MLTFYDANIFWVKASLLNNYFYSKFIIEF